MQFTQFWHLYKNFRSRKYRFKHVMPIFGIEKIPRVKFCIYTILLLLAGEESKESFPSICIRSRTDIGCFPNNFHKNRIDNYWFIYSFLNCVPLLIVDVAQPLPFSLWLVTYIKLHYSKYWTFIIRSVLSSFWIITLNSLLHS